MTLLPVAKPPPGAVWRSWERDQLVGLVCKFPQSCRISFSHNDHSAYSVFRVWATRSVHLTFNELDGGVHITRLFDGRDDLKTIEWIEGGLPAWVDALEISRDDLLAALLVPE